MYICFRTHGILECDCIFADIAPSLRCKGLFDGVARVHCGMNASILKHHFLYLGEGMTLVVKYKNPHQNFAKSMIHFDLQGRRNSSRKGHISLIRNWNLEMNLL